LGFHEVVVHDRIEGVLLVDALAEAVRADKDARAATRLRLLHESLDALHAVLARQGADHALDDGLATELLGELLAKVLGRGDEAAKDHRAALVLRLRREELGERLQLRILRGRNGSHELVHLAEEAPGALRDARPGSPRSEHILDVRKGELDVRRLAGILEVIGAALEQLVVESVEVHI
jgi:hypothetical protein